MTNTKASSDTQKVDLWEEIVEQEFITERKF